MKASIGNYLHAGKSRQYGGAKWRRRFNGAVTGTIGAAVQGRPMKVLLFAVSKPLLFLIAQKNIKDLKQLEGKKIAGGSPGGSATLLANQALEQIGLEPGKDVSVLQMSGSAASRYAVLESGVVEASLLSVPENIIAVEKGYNELLFLGDVIRVSREAAFALRTNDCVFPDEVYHMVRATLRGLQFVWDKNNNEAVTNILMKQWKNDSSTG